MPAAYWFLCAAVVYMLARNDTYVVPDDRDLPVCDHKHAGDVATYKGQRLQCDDATWTWGVLP